MDELPETIAHRAIVGVLALSLGCGGGDVAAPSGSSPRVALAPDKDNTLYQDPSGALSNGAGQFLFAGSASTTNQGLLRRALLHFDVAGGGLPSGARIDSVTLTLRMSRTIAGPADIHLHRVTADWGEGASDAGGAEGMGAPSTSGDATWMHRFFDTAPWSNPGGDFVATASATTPVLTTGTYVWGSTATMVADVRDWIITPGANHGWILIGDETQLTSAKRFESRSTSNAAGDRPALTIHYTAP